MAGGNDAGAAGRELADDGVTVSEIAELLNARAEDLGWMLFPAARKAGGFLCIGSVQGEPGKTLKIHLSGAKRGRWADYATSPSDPAGMGDMLKLLKLTIGGGDMGRAVAEAKRFLNLDTMDPRALERQRRTASRARERAEAEAVANDEKRRRQAEAMWQAATPLTPSLPPVRYLEARGIDFALLGKLPGAIRYRLLDHFETNRKQLPAMVTKLCAIDGSHVATHVTFLEYGAQGWGKLACPPGERWNKKIHGPMTLGAHIALWKGAQKHRALAAIAPGTTVFCSEGIEDGLSYAMANPEARVIAAATLGNMVRLRLPEQAGDFVLLAQNDTKPQPIATLEDAVREQQAQAAAHAAATGGAARLVRVARPPQGIKDWNDWLVAGAGA